MCLHSSDLKKKKKKYKNTQSSIIYKSQKAESPQTSINKRMGG